MQLLNVKGRRTQVLPASHQKVTVLVFKRIPNVLIKEKKLGIGCFFHFKLIARNLRIIRDYTMQAYVINILKHSKS